MLGKLLKRKRKKNKGEEKVEIKGLGGKQMNLDEAPKRKPKKKEEATGPSWASLVLLGLSVVAGLGFWFYGQVVGTGFEGDEIKSDLEIDLGVGENPGLPVKESKVGEGEKVDLEKKGVIIFTK